MTDTTPKRRGRPPRDTVHASLWLPQELVNAARAEVARRESEGRITLARVIAEWAERGRGML